MISGRLLLLAALLCDVSIGCKSRSEHAAATTAESTTEAPSPCPSDAFLEELHAAAFHFQHGPSSVAREHLERARLSAPTPADATSTKILGQLSHISGRLESDHAWAERETENVRVEFGEWSCMPETLHEGFHAKLPPLPR